jgi:hypothetical protein
VVALEQAQVADLTAQPVQVAVAVVEVIQALEAQVAMAVVALLLFDTIQIVLWLV